MRAGADARQRPAPVPSNGVLRDSGVLRDTFGKSFSSLINCYIIFDNKFYTSFKEGQYNDKIMYAKKISRYSFVNKRK